MCKCLNPPKICGKWQIVKSCNLNDVDLTKVNCSNNCSCNNNQNTDYFQITQNNMFLKFTRQSDSKVYMGIWNPIYKYGKITKWEIKIIYSQNDGEFLMQVSKFNDKSCKPSELFFTYTEKSLGANLPIISYGTLKKINCNCC